MHNSHANGSFAIKSPVSVVTPAVASTRLCPAAHPALREQPAGETLGVPREQILLLEVGNLAQTGTGPYLRQVLPEQIWHPLLHAAVHISWTRNQRTIGEHVGLLAAGATIVALRSVMRDAECRRGLLRSVRDSAEPHASTTRARFLPGRTQGAVGPRLGRWATIEKAAELERERCAIAKPALRQRPVFPGLFVQAQPGRRPPPIPGRLRCRDAPCLDAQHLHQLVGGAHAAQIEPVDRGCDHHRKARTAQPPDGVDRALFAALQPPHPVVRANPIEADLKAGPKTDPVNFLQMSVRDQHAVGKDLAQADLFLRQQPDEVHQVPS